MILNVLIFFLKLEINNDTKVNFILVDFFFDNLFYFLLLKIILSQIYWNSLKKEKLRK